MTYRTLAAAAAFLLLALLLPSSPLQALPSAALSALALEIAPVRDELDTADARGAVPRAILERDAAGLRAWRARLDSIAPTALRATPPSDRADATLLRAQLARMARLLAAYRTAPQPRNDAQRLGRANYGNLLRDELLLPYSPSDIERFARMQLVQSVAGVAWLETRAPLAHTVIDQERNGVASVDVVAYVSAHDLITVPAGVTVSHDDPGALVALQRALAARHPDPVRQSATSVVFDAGWAAYASEMVVAAGLFGDDPISRMRVALAQRADAVAALVDVKLAAGDWTYMQAVQFLVRESGLSEQQAHEAATSSALHPGAAVAPLAGRLLLEDLLAEYRKRMSSRGSLRDFHDRLLSYGSVSFAVLAPELLADLPKL